MPVFNRERFVAQAIDSILAQTYTNFELLIVDDGSQDDSTAIIRDKASQDHRIRFIRLDQNRGVSFARNTALESARGDYITLMDSDDISLPKRLHKQVKFLEQNPSIDAIGTSGTAVTEDGRKQLYHMDTPQKHYQILFHWFVGRHPIYPSFMYRRDKLLEMGGYDPSYYAYGDMELFSRMISHTRFANLPDRLLLYRRHGEQISFDPTEEILRRSQDVRARSLIWLWGEAPEETLAHFMRLRMSEKLNWVNRRRAAKNMDRLIESMIASRWIKPNDKPQLILEKNQILFSASPRLYQRACYFLRNRYDKCHKLIHKLW